MRRDGALRLFLLFLVPPSLGDPCPEGEFACSNGDGCVPARHLCDGHGDCADRSDEWAHRCDNCTADELFRCPVWGQDSCIKFEWVCDSGKADCDDCSDELVERCGPEGQFACSDGSKCVMASRDLCDGHTDCDDWSDEWATNCNNCTGEDKGLTPCTYRGQELCFNSKDCECQSEGPSRCIIWGVDRCLGEDCGEGCEAEGQFVCPYYGEQSCLNIDYVCDGRSHCQHGSDEWAENCNNCTAEGVFRCTVEGVDMCIESVKVCDGIPDCDDTSDDMASQCSNCTGEGLFRCPFRGLDSCLSSYDVCDGVQHCDDFSDEFPGQCNNCTLPGLWGCLDGSRCMKRDFVCDDFYNCPDGSDEAECGHCEKPDYLPCPSLPNHCILADKMCDGWQDCPDFSDEILANCNGTCRNQGQLETLETGETLTCRDGSFCVNYFNLCDGVRDCSNGWDEQSQHVQCDCSNFNMFKCSEGGCISQKRLCSATSEDEHLCRFTDAGPWPAVNGSDKAIGSDMRPYMCKGTCYINYPDLPDPLRWPCNDGSKCISVINRCDGSVHCSDGSDELGCPPIVYINGRHALLMSLLAYICLVATYYCLLNSSISKNVNIRNIIDIIRINNILSLPVVLCHPSLTDIDGLQSEFTTVFLALNIDRLFFNQNPQFLLQLLERLELLHAHPLEQHRISRNLMQHLQRSVGVTEETVAVYLKNTVGDCHEAHFFINSLNDPGFLECFVADVRKCFRKWQPKHHSFKIVARHLSPVIDPYPAFLFILDIVKDILLVILLQTLHDFRTTYHLPPSPAEYGFLYAMITCVVLPNVVTGLYCFSKRHIIFKTGYEDPICTFLFDVFIFVVSPGIPLYITMKLASIRRQAKNVAKQLENDSNVNSYFLMKTMHEQQYQSLSHVFYNSKLIEANLEAIPCLMVLSCFLMFYNFSVISSNGQRFTYFYGISRSYLQATRVSQTVLYFGSMLLSFVGPCWSCLTVTIFFKRSSLNLGRKLVLLTYFIFTLLARVLTVVSTLTLPIILRADFMQPSLRTDMTDFLDNTKVRFFFTNQFYQNLETVSGHVGFNTICIATCLTIHLIVVFLHAHCTVSTFRYSSKWDRVLHTLFNTWLVLPFRELHGINHGEELLEERFLFILHSVENLLFLLISQAYYFSFNDFNHLVILYIDLPIVVCISMSLAMLTLYHCRVKLYATVPDQELPPGFPSFTPEDLQLRSVNLGPEHSGNMAMEAVEAAPQNLAGEDNPAVEVEVEDPGRAEERGELQREELEELEERQEGLQREVDAER